MSYFEVCGWIGAVVVLVAYYLNTTGALGSKSPSYQLMNVSGAVFLIFYTYSCKAYASMAVNLIWAIVGLSSLAPLIKARKRKQV